MENPNLMLLLNPKNIKSLLFVLVAVIVRITHANAQQFNKDSLDYYIQKLKNEKQLPIDSVIYYYNKSIDFADIHKKIILLRKEATYLREKGLKESSFQKINEVLELSKKHKLPVIEGLAYLGLSHHYYHFNQFEAAYKAIYKSKEIVESISEKDIESYNTHNDYKYSRETLLEPILFNIGTIALDNDDLDKAEHHFEESLNFAIESNDKQAILDAKINLAGVLHSRNKYIESNKAFRKLLHDSPISESDMSLIFYNIALNYIKTDNLPKAKESIDKSIEFAEKINDNVQLIDLYYHKSRIEKRLKNYVNEKLLLNKSLEGAIEIDDFLFEIDLYKALAECEIALNNPKAAIQWYQKMNILKDKQTKINDNNLYKRIELENKLMVHKKWNDNQLLIIKNEKAHTRLLIWAIVFGVLFSIMLTYALLATKKNNYKKLKLLKQNTKIKEISLENKRIKEEIETTKMQEELVNKKRELMLSLLHSKKRKQKLTRIVKEFEMIENKSIINKTDIQYLKKYIIKQSDDLDNNEEIQQKIVNTHKGFFTKLINDYPDLSKTEIKVLAYMRVGLETKEIAEAQFVSIDAIRKARYRIRKKLNLDSKESLEKFILKY
jgi:DNA-binding CsgD family transcriptional regulator